MNVRGEIPWERCQSNALAVVGKEIDADTTI